MRKTVVELFAGVGGFRVGLNDITNFDKQTGKAIENGPWTFVWSNQWEPETKIQHAFDCYSTRFGQQREDSNTDISKVDKSTIPDCSLLVGGFPCQDYSVARSLSHEKGIQGKKGVLWWQINEILKIKRPPFVLLENVDRLLKSPAKQRGRDFGIMLRCFNDNGYTVEWRVINAGTYGFPQRRRRTYIFAYRNDTNYAENQNRYTPYEIISSHGLFANQFAIIHDDKLEGSISINDLKKINLSRYKSILGISNRFEGAFFNTGYMKAGIVYTVQTTEDISNVRPILLSDVIENKKVNKNYYLNRKEIHKFSYLRGSKKIPRNKNGIKYYYSEGSMSPYDSLDLPSRTMLTSEGSINRSTHIIRDPHNNNRLRILTPIECERLQTFPDNWTNTMPERRRYFMMGNALVCGVIKILGEEIGNIIDTEP